MKIKILSILLVAIGLMQPLGYILGSKTVKGIGLVSMASPLPIVFTKQKGFLETFALEFTVVFEKDGRMQRINITPELYARLEKPYNYRNVLGAVISYGPLLDTRLVGSVLNYAFLEPGVVAKAFGLYPMTNAHIELRSKTEHDNRVYTLPIRRQDAQ